MADLTDAELPGYCEIHSRTERALFHSSHLNRLLALAGHPDGYYKTVREGWYTVRDDIIDPLAKLARERLANPIPAEEYELIVTRAPHPPAQPEGDAWT